MNCKSGISSHSLGRAWVHDMDKKLDEAAAAGIEGVEIFYEDLEHFAKSLPGGASFETRTQAAHQIRAMCDDRSLEIICIQPFLHSEGLRDRQRRAEKIEELKCWFSYAKILRTDMIQIPASFLPESEITGDLDVIVKDCREVAELGAAYDPPLRFAFESLAFSTYINTWEQCWDVVQKVDMPNFGVCLDTFNIAGRVYADPTSASGRIPNADSEIKASMDRLVKTIDVKKIFFVQIVDAEKLDCPLVEGHEFYAPDLTPRLSWSRNCRLFYGEEDRGGYLPIKEIMQAIVKGLGFQGWVSAELFNRSMSDEHASVPRTHAERAVRSWNKLLADLDCQSQQSVSHAALNQKPTMTVSATREVSML